MMPQEILLEYVIEKSYLEEAAFEVLCRFDAARTGLSLEQIRINNTLIRAGFKPGG